MLLSQLDFTPSTIWMLGGSIDFVVMLCMRWAITTATDSYEDVEPGNHPQGRPFPLTTPKYSHALVSFLFSEKDPNEGYETFR